MRLRVAVGAVALAALGAGAAVGAGAGDEPSLPVLLSRGPAEPVPRFEDVAGRAGIALPHQVAGCSGNVAGAAWADVEGDGNLDLYLPQHAGPGRLWLGDGRGRFRDVAAIAGVADVPGATGATFADYDEDGDPDLYVANDHLGFRGDAAWRNDGPGPSGWRFTPLPGGLEASSMGLGIGDLTADGRPDLVVSDLGPPWLLSSPSSRPPPGADAERLTRARFPGRREETGWGAAVEDFDNDGDEDAFVAGGALGLRTERRPDRLYLGDGHGLFQPAVRAAERWDLGRGRGVATADLDRDGLLDLLVARLGEPPLLLMNRGPARGAWLELELHGTRSVADACGARVAVRAGARRHVRWLSCGSEGLGSSGERIVHVGLGPVREYEAIEIAWPSGTIQHLAPGRASRRIEVVEPRRPSR